MNAIEQQALCQQATEILAAYNHWSPTPAPELTIDFAAVAPAGNVEYWLVGGYNPAGVRIKLVLTVDRNAKRAFCMYDVIRR